MKFPKVDQINFSQLLTVFDSDDIKILTDVVVVKILQALKSSHDHNGIRCERKAISSALICRMRRRKKRQNSNLRLVKGSHFVHIFREIKFTLL